MLHIIEQACRQSCHLQSRCTRQKQQRPGGPERWYGCLISVKSADKPDSVHSGYPLRDCHYSGPVVAQLARCYLPAHSGGPVNVCLLGIAARRDCPFHPWWFTLRYAPKTTSLLL